MNTMLTRWLKHYIFWLVLLVLCLILQTLNLAESLRFDRALVEQGDYWLLITAHFVHLNWQHLWLNLAGLILVMVFFAGYCTNRLWLLVIIVSALSVSLGLYWFNTDIQLYVGLSGVLHGLFVVGVWYEYRHYTRSGTVLMVMIIAKLVWEQISGPLPGSQAMTGGHVLVDAHLYGALGGFVFLLLHEVIHVNDGQQNRKHDEQNNKAHEDNQ